MTDKKIEIAVTGFTVERFEADEDEMADVAYAMASSIGGHLADLGRSAGHGKVTITVGDLKADST